MVFAIALVLQAVPIDPAPLETGRWTYRETRDPASGAYGISAALLSEARNARLVVRCDVTNQHTVSVQYLPNRSVGISLSAPIVLERITAEGPTPMVARMIWEPGPNGAFARDGVRDANASAVAADLRRNPGRLRITSADYDGTQFQAYFDDRDGREQIDRILATCPRSQSRENRK